MLQHPRSSIILTIECAQIKRGISGNSSRTIWMCSMESSTSSYMSFTNPGSPSLCPCPAAIKILNLNIQATICCDLEMLKHDERNNTNMHIKFNKVLLYFLDGRFHNHPLSNLTKWKIHYRITLMFLKSKTEKMINIYWKKI